MPMHSIFGGQASEEIVINVLKVNVNIELFNSAHFISY